MKLINGCDVAREAGCSQSTVSRVMRGDPRIGNDTRKRVLDAAKRLGYDMRTAAGTWGVGVIAGFRLHDANGYYANILAAVTDEIFKRGLRMELIWSQAMEESSFRSFRGVIDLFQKTPAELLSCFQVPVIQINGESQRLNNIWSVNSDSSAGIKSAARYLLKKGHRNIWFVSLEGLRSEETKITHRWHGFLEIMHSAGFAEPEKQSIFFDDLLNTDQRQFEAAILNAVKSGCSAIICVNALHTLKLNAALHSLHLRVPEDISVIDWEYDGVSEYLDPPRTTVSTDYQKLASEALDLLTDILEHRNEPQNRLVQPKLIIRKSVRSIINPSLML